MCNLGVRKPSKIIHKGAKVIKESIVNLTKND